MSELEPPRPPAATDATAPAILAAEDVHRTYRMGRVDVPVLRGASLSVREGEWVAVLGASGSGKSTLLHLLGDLDQPDRPGRRRRAAGAGSGRILYEGQPLGRLSRRRRDRYRNRDVGFVFQFYHLLPELTVLENAMLPALVARRGLAWTQLGLVFGLFPALPIEHLIHRRATADDRERTAELLASFGLGHRLRHRPRELSGGERQRVAIARAIVNQPRVLLADEPTGNLDERIGAEILDLLAAQHAEGLTMVMVTHDPTVAARADRVVRLRLGQVVTERDGSVTPATSSGPAAPPIAGPVV